MAAKLKFTYRCNCCRLGSTCMSPRVTTRAVGDIPNCSMPIKTQTLPERSNVDVKITDYAEFLREQTRLFLLGPFKGGINYETWWRRTWNYGSLRPHEGVQSFV